MVTIFVLLIGCNDGTTSSETESSGKATPLTKEEKLLIDAEWVGHDGRCENHITFKEDKFFGNSCACGEPVGDGDLSEVFSYNEKDDTIDLYDCDGELVETAKILFLDKYYLVIDVWDSVYLYENHNAVLPTAHEEVKDDVHGEITKVCLDVRDFSDGELTVTSYGYDGDTPDMFKKWKLKVSSDAVFKSVTVVDDNGNVQVENVTLTEDDYEFFGEYHTTGYFEINPQGEVTSIIFYGETVIYG